MYGKLYQCNSAAVFISNINIHILVVSNAYSCLGKDLHYAMAIMSNVWVKQKSIKSDINVKQNM